MGLSLMSNSWPKWPLCLGKRSGFVTAWQSFIPPPSERRSRQRNKTSRESAAATVWKSCYSKATLYFSIMLKFDMVLWVFRRLSVLWLIVPLDTFRFIHNQPRLLLSAIRTQHYFLQVLESSLFGDKRFSPGSDLRHWKWRGPLHHSQ